LQAIILRELQWTLPEIEIPGGLPIDLRPEFSAQAANAPQLVIYKIETDVSAVIPDEVEMFHLRTVYQAVFSTPIGMEFSQEEVEAFGATAVMLMVFPYVRETLQSTAAKAGLPSILLQPLRLPYVLVGDSESGEAVAEKRAPLEV